ncbi:glyoxal reductase [Salinimicrobium marinum]|uniref:Glyoxal reductase n=1 Tax=Salinimicrobium marinum TaxID=680283 RepID=A0A918SLX8_9FLAO|nr:aldo/keto reductase [Salinimicrobium marinum]GHA49636.1 glyoxal reductase [Salinimicrobium marinum]
MELLDINSKVTLLNGVKMPVLGLGVYKAKNGQQVINAIHYALDAGYRHIDTASFYNNEEGVGEAIRKGNVAREEIFVTTKVWNDDHGFDNTLKAFEASRQKLQLDYIDLYLIHWPVPGKYLETWKALEQLYRERKVKAIGVCNCMEHHLQDIMDNSEIKPMLLQNEFHPRLVQQELLDFCKENQIQYEGWSPLMRGQILTNETLKGLAEKYRKSVAQITLRWNLQKGVVAIPKSVHKHRIEENADIFDFSLSEEEMNLIDSLDREERTGAHPDHFMDHFK